MGLDRRIFLWINQWPDTFRSFLVFFSIAMQVVAVKILLGIIVVAMLWRNPKTRVAILLALIAVGLGNLLTDQFKHLLPMHRPYQAEELGDAVINRVGTSESMGTVSAHASNMAAVATVMGIRLGKWGIPWILVALLTGISRVYVGAHYPWQVLAGWTNGIIVSVIVVQLYESIARKRKISVSDAQQPA